MQLSIKHHIYQCVTGIMVLLFVAGCDMPMRPAGMDTEGMTQIADKLRAQGDDQAAANFYQRALQRAPNDKKARLALIEILEAHGDLEGALVQYNAALTLYPENMDFLRGYGRSLLKHGNALEAKEQYEKALTIESGDIKSLNGLGVALDYLGDHAAAQKYYKEALDDDSDNMSTLSNLGHSYVLSGAYEEAIHLLEPYAENKDATDVLRQNLAEAYGLMGMEADAERMGRMDLSEAEIKKNRAFYRAQRARLSLIPKLYAELGGFPTEAIAQIKKDEVIKAMGSKAGSVKMTVQSDVTEIGGTPHFYVKATGFQDSQQLHAFCERRKKADIPCSEHRT